MPCDSHNDTQEHIFECEKITMEYTRNTFCQPGDVYSNDLETLYMVACTLKKLVKVREDLLEPDPQNNKKSESNNKRSKSTTTSTTATITSTTATSTTTNHSQQLQYTNNNRSTTTAK
jgi:hypothetical protein